MLFLFEVSKKQIFFVILFELKHAHAQIICVFVNGQDDSFRFHQGFCILA